jgi:hypothetical protein
VLGEGNGQLLVPFQSPLFRRQVLHRNSIRNALVLDLALSKFAVGRFAIAAARTSSDSPADNCRGYFCFFRASANWLASLRLKFHLPIRGTYPIFSVLFRQRFFDLARRIPAKEPFISDYVAIGTILIDKSISTHGSVGNTLVKGVKMLLAAEAFSVKSGGIVNRLEVGGDLVTPRGESHDLSCRGRQSQCGRHQGTGSSAWDRVERCAGQQ